MGLHRRRRRLRHDVQAGRRGSDCRPRSWSPSAGRPAHAFESFVRQVCREGHGVHANITRLEGFTCVLRQAPHFE